MGVVDQAVEDSIGDRWVSDVFMPVFHIDKMVPGIGNSVLAWKKIRSRGGK